MSAKDWYWIPNKKKKNARKKTSKRYDNAWYASEGWRKCREAYLSENSSCEVSLTLGIIEFRNLVVDHIIPLEMGGSPYDFRNLMTLAEHIHGKKSRMEQLKEDPLVEAIDGGRGLIPVDREDIIRVLKKQNRKTEHSTEIIF